MSRRRRRNRNSGQRDNNSIAKTLLTSLVREIEDRRQFHPLDDVRPARALSKYAASITVKPYKRSSIRAVRAGPTPDVFRFNRPANVPICVRRKTRREVLFALKRTGKGARKRHRRRNYYSEVSC